MLPWALLLLDPSIEIGAWNVPPDCPSEEAFSEMVRAEAQSMTEPEHAPQLKAEVAVHRIAAEHWQLRLRLVHDTHDDTRTFDAASCEAVVEAAAVVVSLRWVEWTSAEDLVPEPETAEPNRAPPPPNEPPSAPTPPQRPPATPPETPTPSAAPAPPPIRESTPSERWVGGWVGLLGGVAFGVAPDVGGAIALEGGITGRSWRAGLTVATTPARGNRHPDDTAVRGRFDLLTAGAFGCGSPRAGRFEFPLCARLVGGGLRGNATGAVETSRPAWGSWWGAGGSAGASWHVTERWAPALAVEALAPLRTWTFSVGDLPQTPLHRTGPVAVRAWLGVEIHL